MLKRLIPIYLIFGITLVAAADSQAAGTSKNVALFKNPECGCCESYADYLRGNGFTVTVKPSEDLFAMGRKAGIPDDFQGCHLAYVDGYVVSGHVPVAAVRRLLTERPNDVKGITLPGMPAGSPGMGGTKEAPFTVYGIGAGTPRVFSVE